MSKHHKKAQSSHQTQYQLEKKLLSLTVFDRIQANKEAITRNLSGNRFKRMNNIYWLRTQISNAENEKLYVKKGKEKERSFDNPCIHGISIAYDYILENPQEKITVTGITYIHRLLCNNCDTVKTADSFIHAGVIRKTNIPMEIETKLFNIISDLYQEGKHVLFRAFDFHYQMILLQPFDDYNKRTARMVMNWFLVQNGYRPIAFMRKFDKKNYPNALLQMKNNHKKEYYKYMMDSVCSSQERLLKQLKTSRIK